MNCTKTIKFKVANRNWRRCRGVVCLQDGFQTGIDVHQTNCIKIAVLCYYLKTKWDWMQKQKEYGKNFKWRVPGG
ncbi:uncharacterized protein LOC129700845 isoform X3 [Leucoraja erinacea]|uniref:uncharacterized protein LOC129700845 isoform X3 n=1 Tax=Leucoraja erinaceus TaxID=7782 RepID=UPI002454398E|nr:uncharacterized protein LOC129700845 isoform X3 [Leucoraja erinacea]